MRKEFLLGGAPFTAPEVIGAGIRARIAQVTADIADEKKIKNNAEEIIQRYWYDYSLKYLETLLKPESPISIKEAYDSATDEEVQAVMNFFSESVTGKTSSENGNTSDSPSTKRTQKQKT